VHLRVSAPAKVNLSLLVGPGRPDGYHGLFTVFVPIDLVDELDFELGSRGPGGGSPGAQGPGRLQVHCAGVAGEANLAARALRALEQATGWTIEGAVAIKKGIPIGAGLGGGSSDAAAALRAGALAVGEAGGPALDAGFLQAIARTLGADVPFFLGGRPAIARGIGDILEPLRLPNLDVVLVFLNEHLSTPRVYDAFDSMGAPEDPGTFEQRAAEAEVLWKGFACHWDAGLIPEGEVVARIAALLQNDLERASVRLLPLLGEARRVMMREGASVVLMSGSGSTLFTVCRSGEEAQNLTRRLAAKGLSARAARTGVGAGWCPGLP
jgi:4-diphosphocytidyl-2-C-methyl-D-erythritol kinase